MKLETLAVMCRALLICSPQTLIHYIYTDRGSAASSYTRRRKYFTTKTIETSQACFLFLANAANMADFHAVLTPLKSPALLR